ncbi:MAG: hypothetical protein M0R17_07020 [Candidatus Omnitrophica bacterium]|jgi:hypothetical protein|nr:hypothetical protein [Candidatus Omnitrophota bacterium]
MNKDEYEDIYEYLADFYGYKGADKIVSKLKKQGYKGDTLITRMKMIIKKEKVK